MKRTAVILASLVAVACHDPVAPSPTTPVVTSLRIDGPATLTPPGGGRGSGKYTATATYSDGTSKDVTDEARWTIERGTISPQVPLRWTAGGQIEAWTRGEADVVVALAGVTGRRTV